MRPPGSIHRHAFAFECSPARACPSTTPPGGTRSQTPIVISVAGKRQISCVGSESLGSLSVRGTLKISENSNRVRGLEKKSEGVMDSCFFCGQPADNTCPHCGLVSFCSPEHFSFHRPKGRCFPFRVGFSEKRGQHLVATRNIKVGESGFPVAYTGNWIGSRRV